MRMLRVDLRCACSFWRLVCLAFFGAFAAGAVYENYGKEITSFFQTATAMIKVCIKHLIKAFQLQ